MIKRHDEASILPRLFLLSATRSGISRVYRRQEKSEVCSLCGTNLKGEREIFFHRKPKSKMDIESTDLGVFIIRNHVCDMITELSESEVSFSQIAESRYILRPRSTLLFDEHFERLIESDGTCIECGSDLGRSALRVLDGEFVLRAESHVSEFGVYRTDLKFGWAPEMEPLIFFGEAIAKSIAAEFTGAFFDQCRFKIQDNSKSGEMDR
ncbi:MAG: hypothetical protein AAF160_20720 [Pseudomonadota bacterium]